MNLSITVLSPDLIPLGIVNQFTSLTWTSRTTTFGGFELWCPLVKENSELLKPDNLVWTGGDELGVVETIKKSTDKNGITLTVSGRFIESWLSRRIVLGQYSGTGAVSDHIRGMVNMNAISPSNPSRKIPFISLDANYTPLGPRISFSNSYGNLWTTSLDLAKSHSLFPRVVADVPGRTLCFKVLGGTDRSLEQSVFPSVVLSTDLSDILSDSYTLDSTSLCGTAIVAGEGEGTNRKTSVVNDNLSGLSRRELFVDARDLQNDEGWSDSVYDGILQERGKVKLLNSSLVESFNADIRMYGARAYEYGVDYFLGDRVTMQDKNLEVQVSTEISEVKKTWDEGGYGVSLVLGTSAPTITQLLKRKE